MDVVDRLTTGQRQEVAGFVAEFLGEVVGELDAQTAMLKLICRHVGVTADELRAAAEKMRHDQ